MCEETKLLLQEILRCINLNISYYVKEVDSENIIFFEKSVILSNSILLILC